MAHMQLEHLWQFIRTLLCCSAQWYRLGLQVRKLHGSVPITLTQSKNTDVLATTERDTASTTGSSQGYGLNYSLILYLHTCLHSFKYHLLHTTARLAGQPVNRGARKREKTLVTTPPYLEDIKKRCPAGNIKKRLAYQAQHQDVAGWILYY